MDRGGLRIFDLREEHLDRLINLTRKFNDVPMDLADAGLVVAAEHTGCQEIATIDPDFYAYRTIQHGYLENIFLGQSPH